MTREEIKNLIKILDQTVLKIRSSGKVKKSVEILPIY